MSRNLRRKKVLVWGLPVLLVFSIIFQGAMPAFAKDRAKVVDVDIKKFEIQNKDHSTANELYITDTFLLMMNWDASKNEATLHKDDYFDVTLPSNMRFPPDTSASDFDLTDDDGVVLAKAHVIPGPAPDYVGGKIHVVFTDKVENKYNVKGTMYLAARFDRKQITAGETNNFTITVNSDVTGISHSSSDGVIVQGPKPLKDEYLNKWGGKLDGDPNQAVWHVRINHRKGTLTNVKISDSLNLPGESFIPKSFKLFRVNYNEYGDISGSKVPVDISSMLTFGAENATFELNLGDASNQQYYLEYNTTYTPGTKLVNQVKLDSTEKKTHWVSSHQSAESGGTAGGDLASKIKLIKVDAEDESITIANAVFTVTAEDGSTFELTTGADGTITSGVLKQGTYQVQEKDPPRGYELNKEKFTLTVSPAGGAIQKISDKPIKIDVSGTKTWNDGNDQDGKRPKKIVVNLLADKEKVAEQTVTPDENGNWNYSFKNLRKYKKDHLIEYTVTENPVEGYTPEISGYNIKNSYTPEETEVTVTKEWSDADDQDGKRPKKIKVQLYANDKESGEEVELNEGNRWTHTWNKLPKKAKGTDITYTVKETTKVEGYTTTVNDSNIKDIRIRNSHTPETIEVTGEKTWDDADDQDGKRPKRIVVNLLANGQKVKEETVTPDANGKWSYRFAGLAKYKGGKLIEYTVTENSVSEYNAKIDGYNIKNSYTPKETSVTVTKSWDDSNDKDKIRPNTIKVQLYANGEKKGDVIELNAKSKWTHTWNNLPQKAKGKDIAYTVKEVDRVAGYTTKVDDKDHGNIIITNTHVPKVTGPKTGDTNKVLLYFGGLLLAGLALIGTRLAQKRRTN